ncbi:MAG: hypothetical protein NTZ83_04080 [Candidatus Pacearchaeota archaeon]|nr:hypothetical protein [Candidatus Pacearchaeota archaeon]
MATLSFVPEWFFIYGLAFGLAFAIISLVVSLYSFKIYRLSGQRQSKLFGVAFLLFSISYFIQFFLNLAILSELNEKILNAIEFQNVITMNTLSIFAHMILFTLGLVTLIYMILNVKNKWIYSGLMLVSVLFLLFSANKINFFYVFSSVLLIIISIYYLQHSIKHKNSRSLLMVIAFFFLLIGHIHFIFLINHEIEYVLGSFLELAAYILVLVNLLRVLKK